MYSVIVEVRYTEGVLGKKSKVFGVGVLNIDVCFLQNFSVYLLVGLISL